MKKLTLSLLSIFFFLGTTSSVALANTNNVDTQDSSSIVQRSIQYTQKYYSDYQIPYNSGRFPGNSVQLSNGIVYYGYSTYIGGGKYIGHYHGTLEVPFAPGSGM